MKREVNTNILHRNFKFQAKRAVQYKYIYESIGKKKSRKIDYCRLNVLLKTQKQTLEVGYSKLE